MRHGSESIEALRQKSELRRAELKQTIRELSQTISDTTTEIKTAVSPSHLKSEAWAYADERRKRAVSAVKEHAVNYPLQTLAIGAAVAYPLLGIVRRVPVPLALLGAGLLLSRNGRSSLSDAAPNGNGHADQQNGTAEESAYPSVSPDPDDRAGSNGYADVTSAAADMTARAGEMAAETRSAALRMMDRNPLLVGGLAVAVGGLIAASLPASRIEERAGRGLREQGRHAAAEAVKGVKARVANMADDISAAVREEGVTREALDEAVDSATDKVASVVTRAVDEAVSAEQPETYSAYESDGDKNGRF
jgi:hypothetical protein